MECYMKREAWIGFSIPFTFCLPPFTPYPDNACLRNKISKSSKAAGLAKHKAKLPNLRQDRYQRSAQASAVCRLSMVRRWNSFSAE